MADDQTSKEDLTVRNPQGERFGLDHAGGVAVFGNAQQAPLRHQVGGQVIHATPPEQPLVHMVCWDEDRRLEVSGQVALVGNDKAPPIRARMTHEFANPLEHKHRVEPLDHALHVNTHLAKPIHHALQMRTPLQLRFCNAWHLTSDYSLEIRLWDNRVLSVRLTGATIAAPQPCPEDQDCVPSKAAPGQP